MESDKNLLSEAKRILLDKHQELFKWQKAYAAINKICRASELQVDDELSRRKWLQDQMLKQRTAMESRRRREEVFLLSVSNSIEILIQKFERAQAEATSPGVEEPGARAAGFRAATTLLKQQRSHAENKEAAYLQSEVQKKSALLTSKRAERQNLEARAMTLNSVTPSRPSPPPPPPRPPPRPVDPAIASSGTHRRGYQVLNEGNAGAPASRSSSSSSSSSSSMSSTSAAAGHGVSGAAAVQGRGPSAFTYQRGNEWFRKRSYANTFSLAESDGGDDDLEDGPFDANGLATATATATAATSATSTAATATGEGGAGAAQDAFSSHRRSKNSRSDSFYAERSTD
jgi:hypothetical protein